MQRPNGGAKDDRIRGVVSSSLAALAREVVNRSGTGRLDEQVIGIGIDLVTLEEVHDSIENFGDSYIDRVYTTSEILDARATKSTIECHLAMCFAAKEAVLKALRPSEVELDWRWIEIVHAKAIATVPDVAIVAAKLSGGARELAITNDVGRLSVQVMKRSNLALALAVATLRPKPRA